ncbi:MAG: helix-turn-helix transcriptional regulator [Phycisphaerales bacterium]|nr:helix-turn-helix transcriptional regulator [Phycisphaerales bacterium]
MPRAATTADVFNAIAEPRRREILDLLARAGELAVGALVEALRLPQPAVSKHLGVLRAVGLVSVKREGQRRVYAINAAELRPVHQWVSNYERLWTHQVDSIQRRAERRARMGSPTKKPNPQRKEVRS